MGIRMRAALTLVLLLRCWCVSCLPRKQPVSFSMVFSSGLQLLLDEGDDKDSQKNMTTGSSLSIQIFSSVPLPQDPHRLVCLISGLNSPLQEVWWWVNDTAVASSDAQVFWSWSEESGDYSATSVWEVSAAGRGFGSSYWCGTVQDGRVYRQRLCSEDCW